jgi:hypothetical protein
MLASLTENPSSGLIGLGILVVLLTVGTSHLIAHDVNWRGVPCYL